MKTALICLIAILTIAGAASILLDADCIIDNVEHDDEQENTEKNDKDE